MNIGDKYLAAYPGKLPLIVFYLNIKSQLLIPDDTRLDYLITVIRRNMKIPHLYSISLLIDNKILISTDSLKTIYSKYRNDCDGCLHLSVKVNSL